ncbi:MAG: zinc ribbon domain-containing protein, partial [Acidobacteria bacterium]
MPIYEYTCKDCSTTFARLQKIGADTNGIVCPTCKSSEVERKISSFSGGAGGAIGSST